MKTINSTCLGFTTSYDEVDSVLVIELDVDRLIDFSLISDIEKDIISLVSRFEPSALVLGFQNVSVFSSEVVSVVVDLQRTMMHRGGSLKLTGLNSPVGEIFHQLNLDESIVQIHETTSDALADLKENTHTTA